MSRELAGRTALITGSTSGIGLAIAEALAARGADLVLNGLEEAGKAEGLRARLAATHGIEVLYRAADMGKGEEIRHWVREAEARFGAVDILVNNVGIQFVSPVDQLPDEQWEAIIGVNLSSAFYATKEVIPGMRQRGWGRIVNIASTHGLVATPFKAAYAAAKHGLVGFTKAVALELAESGVTVNAICPGFVHTDLVDRQIGALAEANRIPRERVIQDIILAAQPTKRFTKAEHVGEMCVFLASAAAENITGAALSIDGGWTAR